MCRMSEFKLSCPFKNLVHWIENGQNGGEEMAKEALQTRASCVWSSGLTSSYQQSQAKPVMLLEVTLAPIVNKPGAGSVPKRGAGLPGKSSGSAGKGSDLLGGKNSNSSTKPTSGKSLFPTSSGTGKSTSSYESPTATAYSSSKSNKTAFGIIWLPTRKHNKQKKDLVYNPHREDRRVRDRSPSMYNLMSGDSPDNLPRKRDDEATLLMPERAKAPAPPVASVTAAEQPPQQPQPEPAPSDSSDEKREFIQRDKNENKEAAGDSIDDKDDKEYLENDDIETNKSPKGKTDDKNLEKNKFGDKVDSVYLRPPPPHKARSTTSTANDEEDCGIKCLYYTLQCCDCVLM